MPDVRVFDVLTHPLFLASALAALALAAAAVFVWGWPAPATQAPTRLSHMPRHALPAAPVVEEEAAARQVLVLMALAAGSATTALPVVEHVGATEDYAAELISLRDAPDSDAFFEADLAARFAALIASCREEPDWLTEFRAGTDQCFASAATAAGKVGHRDPLVDTCEFRVDDLRRLDDAAKAGAAR